MDRTEKCINIPGDLQYAVKGEFSMATIYVVQCIARQQIREFVSCSWLAER